MRHDDTSLRMQTTEPNPAVWPFSPGARTFITPSDSGIERAAQSTDGVWSVNRLLGGADVRCLATDPLNPCTVYAGTNAQGLLRSTDGGNTWYPVGLEGMAIRSVAVSPAQSEMICVGTKPPASTSPRDGGTTTWQDLPMFRQRRQWWWFTPAEPGPEYVQSIALSPRDPEVILAGIELGAVLRSDDAGRTWSTHRKGALRDCHTLTFHAKDGRWAYESGGSGAGASISRDGGQTWSQPRRDRLRRMAQVPLMRAFIDPQAARSGRKSRGRSPRCPTR
jgi:photosystem II stability/assembly factor-like uncharacterized protein